MISTVIWARGYPAGHGPHDASCPCNRHCRVCLDDLRAARAARARVRRARLDCSWLPVTRLGCTPQCRRQGLLPRRVRRALGIRQWRDVRGL